MPPKSRKRKKKVEEEDANEAPPAKRRKGNNEEEDGDDDSKTDVKEQKLSDSQLTLAPNKDIRDTDLVPSLDKDLVCCICLLLMDDPHSFPCGHSFCKGLLPS
jgi:hypothetical protein